MRRNAWALTITADGVTHHAGDGVEIGDGFIAEGAWAGDFSADGLVTSTFRCGSGAVLGEDEVTLCAPSHSVEPIYYFRRAGSAIASNSLHLIVALDDGAAPPSLVDARRVARTLSAGRLGYERALYETDGGTMMRLAFGTARLSRTALTVSEDPYPETTVFHGFTAYRQHLHSVLRSILDNARDPQRAAPYSELVTTVSRGYDSPACAALGAELGAETAVTLNTGRGNFSDSGKDVATALGLPCHEYERFGLGLETNEGRGQYDYHLDASHLGPEHADFMATINSSEDLFFASFEPHLAGTVVLTGFHGDKAWDMKCSSGPEIKRGDNSGTGLDEFRKRVGFVNVPVPFIGVDNHAELARLCESEEMSDYRVGGRYDRPLPRRIAEDAGVPREAFGVKKSMGSTLLKNTGQLRARAFYALVDEYRASIDGS